MLVPVFHTSRADSQNNAWSLKQHRFGEFRQWFHMSLGKVEELTTILINREYITRPRSHHLRKVFWERSELLVMSALYLLVTGATFRCCKPLCGICTSEVCKFFYIFIEALVDMKDEYIYIPWNITEMQCISRDYNAAGLPGCVGALGQLANLK